MPVVVGKWKEHILLPLAKISMGIDLSASGSWIITTVLSQIRLKSVIAQCLITNKMLLIDRENPNSPFSAITDSFSDSDRSLLELENMGSGST